MLNIDILLGVCLRKKIHHDDALAAERSSNIFLTVTRPLSQYIQSELLQLSQLFAKEGGQVACLPWIQSQGWPCYAISSLIRLRPLGPLYNQSTHHFPDPCQVLSMTTRLPSIMHNPPVQVRAFQPLENGL